MDQRADRRPRNARRESPDSAVARRRSLARRSQDAWRWNRLRADELMARSQNSRPGDPPRHHSTLYDFRDLDLMLKIAAEGGEAETWELTEALGFGEQDRQGVAIRLSWMNRYGMVRFDQGKRLWRLSPSGERVTQARVKAGAKRALDSLDDENMVDVMAHVTSRYRHGDPMLADLLRREFLFGTQRGKR